MSNLPSLFTMIYLKTNLHDHVRFEPTPQPTRSVVIYYYISDANGTAWGLTDSSGTVVWSADYDSYGNATFSGTIDQPLRMPGQYHDTESGLYYNLARYYEPTTGRYLSVDPLRDAEDYTYAAGNPLKYVDPTGLWSTEAHNELLARFGRLHGFAAAEVEAMQRGSEFTDSAVYQVAGYSFMHAMTSAKIPSEKSACDRAKSFVSDQLQQSWQARRQGRTFAAAFHLGQALHTVMDSMSPSHGFQKWSAEKYRFHGEFSDSQESLAALRNRPDLANSTVEKMTKVFYGGALDCSCAP